MSVYASSAPQPYTPAFKQSHEASAPRALVVIDNQTYTPKSYSLSLNVHGSSDTATVVVPIQNYPDWTQVIARSEQYGNANKPVTIQIYAGFPSNLASFSRSQLSRRFNGVVDQYEIDRDAGITTFTCRSLAAPLITNKITVGLQGGPGNNTTVAFVKQIAAKYNLQTNIQCPKPGTITDVLAQNYVAGVRVMGIWDLLLKCAQYDDVDLWVDDQGMLWYASPTGLARNTVTLIWGQNFKGLKITHSPQFSKNVRVEVRSWQKRTKQSTTYRTEDGVGPNGEPGTYGQVRTVTSQPIFGTNETVATTTSPTGVNSTTISTATGGTYLGVASAPAAYSGKERYVYNVRNKTPEQCIALSQQYGVKSRSTSTKSAASRR